METLSEDEQHVARVAADVAINRLKPTLHKFMVAIAIVGGILLVGVTAGWLIVQSQARAIQTSRFEATRDNCRATNERYREVILALAQVTPTAPRGGLTRKEQAQQIESTVFLLRKMLPTHPSSDPTKPDPRTCEQFAHDAVAT